MSRPVRRLRARVAIGVRQNVVALSFVALWLVANGVVFRALPAPELLEVLVGLARAPGPWGRLYQPFTQVVVFGVVASMVVTNVTRRHRPELTARLLADEARDHVVVIGLTNLGVRIRDAAIARGVDVVVVDDDRERIAPLLRDESPLVVGDGRHAADLAAAGVERARVVAVATDDVTVAVLAAREVRARNPKCELIVRCPDDDVGDVIGKAYRARIVSTSRLFAKRISEDAARRGTRRALVLGDNGAARRVVATLDAKGVSTTRVDADADLDELATRGVAHAELVVIADDDLGANLVRVDRLRELAPDARIVCRVFHEDAAEVLARAPFRCEVVSTSRHALEVLVREGALRSIGVTRIERGGEPARAVAGAA